MKKMILGFLSIFICVACATQQESVSDVYIRHVFYKIAGTGERTVDVDPSSEMWIGADKIRYSTPGWTLILHRNEQKIFFLNMKEKTYVEASLPLDTAHILSDDIIRTMGKYPTTGEVTDLGKTREILGKTCDGYRIRSWVESSGKSFQEKEYIVWAMRDGGFDMSLHDQLLRNLRKIYSRTDQFQEELSKIRGFQLGLESTETRYPRWEELAVELTRKRPPAGIYDVPKDFTKKKTIDLDDLS
ncbi:MAG TPA: hypothetical protein PK014_01975 [Thermoanaerobaculia bacterium]|nr:hypothetical protein [Thermoanaerobaculia bacterium]HUM28539.1 hypothetical protein [Thermoanaerobaculia bacterium]HXK66853.1 hypothetical protein [Thermoanaerobaculia bacterium]